MEPRKIPIVEINRTVFCNYAHCRRTFKNGDVVTTDGVEFYCNEDCATMQIALTNRTVNGVERVIRYSK